MVTPPPRLSFPTVLVVAMGASTFSLAAFAVLAADLIAEFDVDRWQIGALVTATTITGALASPVVGNLTDRVGARSAVLLTLGISSTGLAGLALAPSFVVLAAVALFCGIGQALANPSTNKLISLHVPAGRRGVITGLKQSGVQFGTFLGGILLPVIALEAGWRWAIAAFAVVGFLGLVLAAARIPRDDAQPVVDRAGSGSRVLPPLIWRLAVYGFLLGAGGTAIFTYLPLFAEETLGFESRMAGLAVAFTGLIGVVGRIGWGRISEGRLGAIRSLRIIAVLSVVAAVLLIASTQVTWLVWPAAFVTGLSASSWNAVGMLAIIEAVPARLAGRGSGVVLLGFLFGLGVGAPAFGFSVDRLGSYVPGWIGISAIFVAGLLATGRAAPEPADERTQGWRTD